MRRADVSRETIDRLDILAGLIRKWSSTINLVAPSTLPMLEQRHILDSLQIRHFAPPLPVSWLDIGTGAGFPGLVIAAELADSAPECQVTFIESDKRKAVFLQQASKAMGLTPRILARRIEEVAPQAAQVISARALASVEVLCQHVRRHLQPDGVAIFLKGQTLDHEVAQAAQIGWRFDAERHKSNTDDSGVILVMRNLRLEH
ncbi:MAG: 16S rRNA (guanine(527)-N(7))-methyltransferase RsmG [Rhodobacteraceae bacterium]|nr:16S rRNA (guanine(527)-N(7))-methyltransferase RsmG [Paracoccaceae bacterium]